VGLFSFVLLLSHFTEESAEAGYCERTKVRWPTFCSSLKASFRVWFQFFSTTQGCVRLLHIWVTLKQVHSTWGTVFWKIQFCCQIWVLRTGKQWLDGPHPRTSTNCWNLGVAFGEEKTIFTGWCVQLKLFYKQPSSAGTVATPNFWTSDPSNQKFEN
jgi:hypothetical protein